MHLLLIDILPRPKGYSFADAIMASLGLDLPLLPPPFVVAYRVGEVVPVGDDMGMSADARKFAEEASRYVTQHRIKGICVADEAAGLADLLDQQQVS